MRLDPRTPVLVGAGTATQRFDDPLAGDDAIGLMRRALDAAAADVGAAGAALLDRVDEVAVPEGIWATRDPGRLVLAGRSPEARSVMGAIGILQQSLFTRAAAQIRDGQADVVVVCGGEAKWRSLRAQITGVHPPEQDDRPGGTADVTLAPDADIHDDVELFRNLANPTHQYAVMESAIAHDAGRTPADQARLVAELVAGLSTVAAANPEAWLRRAVTADDVLAAPLVAEPYTKPACSQWNVDQAAAFLLCSAGTAEALGVARDRWVFPSAGAESNLMVPLSHRAQMHRSPATAEVGRALTELDGRAPADADAIEVYSCFPAAVQMQCRELGIALDPHRPPSITGGMHFAGGPLNSFTLQALARAIGALRGGSAASALITSISGMVTKVGAGTWSAAPSAHGFRDADVTGAATAATEVRRIDADHIGPVAVAGWTIGHRAGAATEAVVVGDTPAGDRVVATSTDPDLLAAMSGGDWCGATVHVAGADLVDLAGH